MNLGGHIQSIAPPYNVVNFALNNYMNSKGIKRKNVFIHIQYNSDITGVR